MGRALSTRSCTGRPKSARCPRGEPISYATRRRAGNIPKQVGTSGIQAILLRARRPTPSQLRGVHFPPVVHGTTHVGAVSPRKTDQLQDEATGGRRPKAARTN